VVLNLLFLPPGPYLESYLEESRGWAAAAGWCRISTEFWVNGVRGFVGLGVDPTPLGFPSWNIPTAALVTSVSWASAALPTVVLRWSGLNGASARVRIVGIAGAHRGDG